jgi:hypothetical protein
MPIVPNRIYTTADVETMFRASEYRPTDYHSEAEAHGFSRHIGVTNAAMMLRAQGVQRGIVAITAFPDNQSAFLAGAMVLNSRVAQAALNDLANGHTGMRAIITWATARPVVIRYVTASNQLVKTMPCEWFRMIVDRSEQRPLGIHLQTFFGLLDPNARNQARVETREGRPAGMHL